MTYDEFIQNIIDTRGRFGIIEGYKERHHIVPRCMNGSDDESNLIDLTAQEHYNAHKLLALENTDSAELASAWFLMSTMTSKGQQRYKITSEEYAEMKEHYANIFSIKFSGEGNPMYGKSSWDGLTEEEANIRKVKLSKAMKGKPQNHCNEVYKGNGGYNKKAHWYNNGVEEHFVPKAPDETYVLGRLKSTKNKISKTKTGIPNNNHWSKESRPDIAKKISEAKKGKHPNITDEQRKARSDRMRNNHHTLGLHWYNNGIENRCFKEGTQPEGFVRGKLLSEKEIDYHKNRLTKKGA